MLDKLVIHRDIKLRNMMLHFFNESNELLMGEQLDDNKRATSLGSGIHSIKEDLMDEFASNQGGS